MQMSETRLAVRPLTIAVVVFFRGSPTAPRTRFPRTTADHPPHRGRRPAPRRPTPHQGPGPVFPRTGLLPQERAGQFHRRRRHVGAPEGDERAVALGIVPEGQQGDRLPIPVVGHESAPDLHPSHPHRRDLCLARRPPRWRARNSRRIEQTVDKDIKLTVQQGERLVALLQQKTKFLDVPGVRRGEHRHCGRQRRSADRRGEGREISRRGFERV